MVSIVKTHLEKEEDSPIVIMSSSHTQIEEAEQEVKRHLKHENIATLNEELKDVEQLNRLERARVLLINDKYLSKLILTFHCHGLPNHLINLDLTGKYCSIFKRLRLIHNPAFRLNCSLLLCKEGSDYHCLQQLKHLIKQNQEKMPKIL